MTIFTIILSITMIIINHKLSYKLAKGASLDRGYINKGNKVKGRF